MTSATSKGMRTPSVSSCWGHTFFSLHIPIISANLKSILDDNY